MLSKKHLTLRKEAVLIWIRENIKWSKVIFYDEKRFCQDGPDSKCSFVPKNVVLHRNKRQNGGRGIIVWGMAKFLSKKFLGSKTQKNIKICYPPLLCQK